MKMKSINEERFDTKEFARRIMAKMLTAMPDKAKAESEMAHNASVVKSTIQATQNKFEDTNH